MELLDDYIGVSNTNMHLRAATGRSARVLVTHPGEFRWQVVGNTSPWFPGFILYRQGMILVGNVVLQTLNRSKREI